MNRHFNQFEALNTALLVLSFAPPTMLPMYRDALDLRFGIASDPERKAYAAYGLARGSRWRVWGPTVIWNYLKLLLKGRKLQRPQGDQDLYQLGGDFIIDATGQLVWSYQSRGPDDRPGPELLLEQLRALNERG